MMDHLPIAVCLLLAGLIVTPVIAHFRAAAVRNFSLVTSSPAGELVTPTHKTMSQSNWYQNRGPANRCAVDGYDSTSSNLPSYRELLWV